MASDAFLASVTDILLSPTGERYYREGSSPWPQGRDDRPGKSMAEATRERRNQINLLRRADDSCGRARALAACLAGCRPDARCVSGACEVCDLARHRLVVDTIGSMLARQPDDWILITCIATRSTVRRGELLDERLFGQVRRLLRAVLARTDTPIVGGLELSLNIAETGWHRPRWIEGGHILAPRAQAEALRRRLRRAFPATRGVGRPVRIDTFDRSARGTAYATKNRALRRVELDRTRRDDRHRHSTRWKALRQAERVELALAQDRAGLDACFFLHGLMLVTQDGLPLLVRV